METHLVNAAFLKGGTFHLILMDCTTQPGDVLSEFVTWLSMNSLDVSTIIIALMSMLRSMLMLWPSLIELDFENSQRKIGTGLVILIILFDLVCHIKGYFPPLYYHLTRKDDSDASNHFVTIRRFCIIGSTSLVVSLRICQCLWIKYHRENQRACANMSSTSKQISAHFALLYGRIKAIHAICIHFTIFHQLYAYYGCKNKWHSSLMKVFFCK